MTDFAVAHHNYTTSLLNHCESNKEQWNVINKFIRPGSSKSNNIESINFKDNELRDPEIIANAFNEFSVSIGPDLANKINICQDPAADTGTSLRASNLSSDPTVEPDTHHVQNFCFFFSPTDPDEKSSSYIAFVTPLLGLIMSLLSYTKL